jgi:uncharacterized protein with HEPN domain
MKTVEYKRHIAEILKAAERLEKRSRGLGRDDFLGDRARVAAAGDDLASIGRAVQSLPGKIRLRYPAIDWDVWPGMAGASGDGLWDAVTRRVPAFGRQVGLILLDITD